MLYSEYITALETLTRKLDRAKSTKTRQGLTNEIAGLMDTYGAKQRQLNTAYEITFAAKHTKSDRVAMQLAYDNLMETNLDTYSLDTGPDGLDTAAP